MCWSWGKVLLPARMRVFEVQFLNRNRGTFPMRKSTGSYPSLTVDTTAKRVVAHAGAVLLAATAGRVGLDRELSAALRPWMRPLAIHDPGKVLLDLAISVAIGGDCLADIAQVRTEPKCTALPPVDLGIR